MTTRRQFSLLASALAVGLLASPRARRPCSLDRHPSDGLPDRGSLALYGASP